MIRRQMEKTMPITRLRIRLNAGAGDHTFVLAYLSDFGAGTVNYLQVVRGQNFLPQGSENSPAAETYRGGDAASYFRRQY